MRTRPAFTIFEVLMVVAFLAALVGFTSIVGTQAIRNGEFDQVKTSIHDNLIQARGDTISGTKDAAWGVAFFAHSLTRFKGASYASRDASYDLTETYADDITLTAPSEIDFQRTKGAPTVSSTVVITDGVNHSTTTVNGLGAVIQQ